MFYPNILLYIRVQFRRISYIESDKAILDSIKAKWQELFSNLVLTSMDVFTQTECSDFVQFNILG